MHNQGLNSSKSDLKGDTFKGIRISSQHSFDDLPIGQQAWDVFMESISAEVFLSYDWCRLWWKYYGKNRELRIFLFTKSDEVVAILPVFYERLRIGLARLRAVKLIGTDYMPVTISMPIRHDCIKQIVPLFLRELDAIWNWDAVQIGDLSGRYPQANELAETLGNALNGVHAVQCSKSGEQCYYEIADSLKHQISTLSKKERQLIRRDRKDLSERSISSSSVVATGQNFEDMFQAFVIMHQTKWQQRGRAGHFVDWPYAQEFHKEIAAAQMKRDRLRLLKITLNDQCVGYEYMYKFGDMHCWYLNSRVDLPEFPRIRYSRISFGETIKQAISDGVKYADAMRGEYDYKLRLGGQLFPIHNIVIYPSRLWPYLRYVLFQKSAWLLHIVYMKIWRARLAPRLKTGHRPLWNLWIRTSNFGK